MASLQEDGELGCGLQEHFDAGHEATDFAEVGVLHQLAVNGQRPPVVTLHDRLHNLMKTVSHGGGQLERETRNIYIYF